MKRKHDNELETTRNKKQKITNLTIFAHLPLDLFDYFILPLISRDFLFVSKEYNALAIKHLHFDPRVTFNPDTFNKVIQIDNRPAFKMHLKYGKLSAQAMMGGFSSAAGEGNYSMIKYLLNNEYLDKVGSDDEKCALFAEAAAKSIINNRPKIVKLLLRRTKNTIVTMQLLYFTACRELPKMIKIILENGSFAMRSNCGLILRKLAEKNDAENVKRMLSDERFIFPEDVLTSTLRDAICFDYYEVVEAIALHGGFSNDQRYIEVPINRNDPKMLKHLLKLGVFDPMVNDAWALRLATFCRSKKMAKMLLKDPRMNLTGVPAMAWAYYSGYKSVVKKMLKRSDVNPICRDPNADPMALNAPSFFTPKIIQGSLFDYKPPQTPEDEKDPTIFDTILQSFFPVNIAVVFLLLNDPRVNFDYYAGYIIARAMQSKKPHVAEAILNDPRVHMIDKLHRRIAIDCAKQSSLKELVAKIRALKKTKLDFKCNFDNK